MGRYYRTSSSCDILAIGIKGDLSSFCGAIKRFQRHGIQSNGLLSLKELCARRIALIKNEQLKWFITAYLPPNLFKYVTKDIFDLRRDEFKLNYAKDFHMCEACSINDYKQQSSIKCRCPKLEAAIHKLNNYFFNQMNNDNKMIKNKARKFELIYIMPHGEEDYFIYENDVPHFFLYLSPAEYFDEKSTTEEDDMDGSVSCQTYQFLKGQISVEDKLLFVDVMRFFGAFRINHDQPELIMYHRQEITSDY
ncbi:unnamed protein product [Rotaria sp. Silwood1]|nr:unnamed protein product [Rotaria sp. Silwood1]CAF1574417.1 unnamed protein product [Rotaria sp. Silwood1]CAF3749360.1 unnamed protein product [Rotaria sp. Silwood1]CAF4879306.1 unnamed protein product [Rotaria sp. Silwood1]